MEQLVYSHQGYCMKKSDFQRKMCFNLTIPNMVQYKVKRKGRGEKNAKVEQCGNLSGLFPLFTYPGKCFVSDAECRLRQFITKARFQAGLFSTVQVSEHSEQIYQQPPHSGRTGDLGIYSLTRVIHVITFQDCILLMDSSMDLA